MRVMRPAGARAEVVTRAWPPMASRRPAVPYAAANSDAVITSAPRARIWEAPPGWGGSVGAHHAVPEARAEASPPDAAAVDVGTAAGPVDRGQGSPPRGRSCSAPASRFPTPPRPDCRETARSNPREGLPQRPVERVARGVYGPARRELRRLRPYRPEPVPSSCAAHGPPALLRARRARPYAQGLAARLCCGLIGGRAAFVPAPGLVRGGADRLRSGAPVRSFAYSADSSRTA